MNNWTSALIAADKSIICAIEVINRNSVQMAMVIDDHGQLIGTVTDGDVRRAILKGISLESSVSEIMEKKFTAAREHQSEKEILDLMQRLQLRHIPVLDAAGQVCGLKVLMDLLRRSTLPNLAVIMAGGLGSRLMPLTETCPKPMVEVGGRPVLEIILEGLHGAGLRRILLSLNYKGEMIENYFGDGSRFDLDISYVREEKPLGTAGALSLLPQRPTEPFLVMNGDLLTRVDFASLLSFHRDQKATATMCLREYEMEVPYGVAKVKNHRLVSLVEKPCHRFFVNAGVYAFEPNVLDFLETDTRLDMPDLFNRLIAAEKEVAAFPIHEYWLDIGRHSDLARARQDYPCTPAAGPEEI